jgi:hypothetical protein
MPPKKHLDEKLVVEKYSQLKNAHKVGDLFNVSNTLIIKILKRNNVEVIQRRYFVNETYFDEIDTEEKAYWLGFLYADGFIRERFYTKGKSRGNSLGINLGIKDIDHLELFKKCIGSTHKISIKESTTVSNKGKKHSCMMGAFHIYSNRLVESIQKQGFHSRKTFTIGKPPIEEKYYSHFIRGFFDGDGCCHVKRIGDRVYGKYEFCCASEELGNFLIEVLGKNSIQLKRYGIVLKCRTNLDCLRFYKYLYNDSSIHLERKKQKGEQFVNYMEMKKIEGVYCFQNEYVVANRVWGEKEIEIVKKYQNKIPLSYLTYSLLPNKSKSQINRLCIKLDIKNDKKMSRKDYETFCYENNIIPYIK